MRLAEYIWIDGTEPVGRLRSKTKVLKDIETPPVWNFDGSSTGQATTEKSDCRLVPVKRFHDPLLGDNNLLILCEVEDMDGTPGKNNHRRAAVESHKRHNGSKPIFGIEQEYLVDEFDNLKLGVTLAHDWTMNSAPEQGRFYCSVGYNNAFRRDFASEHLIACIKAKLNICGINLEVMPGQWEFQIGPVDPIKTADELWIARYLLYRLGEKHGLRVMLDSKPHPDFNGSGCHTNFSTAAMRRSYAECIKAAWKLGLDVVSSSAGMAVGKTLKANKFPKEYGHDYKSRLTGEFETCSYKQFKFGIGDRGASVRIPSHVRDSNGGYIEDRRPCADADPYQIVTYIMETTK